MKKIGRLAGSDDMSIEVWKCLEDIKSNYAS